MQVPSLDHEVVVSETLTLYKDSPAALAGAPAGVQLAGRRWNEEYLLKVTKVCDAALVSYRDQEK